MLYGNNIKGDELNNNERIYIAQPTVGIYQVNFSAPTIVAGSCLGSDLSPCQSISVVSIVSGVTEFIESFQMESNSNNDFVVDCQEKGDSIFYISLQAFYPLYSSSDYWKNSTVTIESIKSDFSVVLTPSTISANYANTWLPCSTVSCLKPESYQMVLFDDAKSVGAAIDACGAYANKFQLSVSFTVHAYVTVFGPLLKWPLLRGPVQGGKIYTTTI